jgi:hypothetical protein
MARDRAETKRHLKSGQEARSVGVARQQRGAKPGEQPRERDSFMRNTSSVWRLLALALAVAVGGACSDGAKTGAPTQTGQPAVTRVASAQVPLSSAALEAGVIIPPEPEAGVPDAGLPNSPYVFALPMPPSTECVVYPEGVSNDPSRNDIVVVDASGEIRFYQPPSAWGTKISFQCTLNGIPQGNYLVDLNDSSTFTAESKSELEPYIVGTRPVLAGDLSTISNNHLLQNGYPPRPDPVQTPSQYARWVQSVTQPMDILSSVQIAWLGPKANVGSYVGSTLSGDWTGFIQCASGFTSEPGNPLTTTLWAANTTATKLARFV